MSTKGFTVFFVLNRYVNGQDGEFAITSSGEQLKDGWYFMIDIFDDAPPHRQPFKSEQLATENAIEYLKEQEELNH